MCSSKYAHRCCTRRSAGTVRPGDCMPLDTNLTYMYIFQPLFLDAEVHLIPFPRENIPSATRVVELMKAASTSEVRRSWRYTLKSRNDTVWKCEVYGADCTTSDLKTVLDESLLSENAVDVGMAFALHYMTRKDVTFIPYNLLAAAHVNYPVENAYEAKQIYANNDKTWVVSALNTELRPKKGRHWMLVMQENKEGDVKVYDPMAGALSEDDTIAVGKAMQFFDTTHWTIVPLGVQYDGCSCGAHVIASFFKWLCGDMEVGLKQGNDKDARTIATALLQLAVHSEFLWEEGNHKFATATSNLLAKQNELRRGWVRPVAPTPPGEVVARMDLRTP
jgi:hypothetical protein